MTKIKYLIIFLFVVYNTNSQTEQLISKDSLNVIYAQNYNLKKNTSPNEFSNLFIKFQIYIGFFY